MIKKLMIGIILTSSLLSINAMAKNGFYLGTGLGLFVQGDSKEVSGETTLFKYEQSYEPTIAFNVKIGYKYKNYSFDIERVSHTNEIDSMEFSCTLDGIFYPKCYATNLSSKNKKTFTTTFINVYYTFTENSYKELYPLIGIGFGKTDIDVKSSFSNVSEQTYTLDDSDTTDTFHVTVGAEKQIDKNLLLDIKLRIIKYDDISVTDSSDVKISQSFKTTTELAANIRYVF